MRKLITLFATIMLTTALVKAQSSDPELDYIKKTYSKEKKEIVSEYLKLDSTTSSKFTVVYDAFESERQALATKHLSLITEYVDNVEKLTPELADKLAKNVLSNNVSLSELNLKYYNKLKKVIGAVNAAKFFQMETYLQTSWRMIVQDNIPMIGELDKHQNH